MPPYRKAKPNDILPLLLPLLANTVLGNNTNNIIIKKLIIFFILSSSLDDKSFSHSASPIASLVLKNSKYFTLSSLLITTGDKLFFSNS